MKPRHDSTPSADRGAWVARAAVVVGLAASLGVLAYAGDGLDVPAIAGMQPESGGVGGICAAIANVATGAALGAL